MTVHASQLTHQTPGATSLAVEFDRGILQTSSFSRPRFSSSSRSKMKLGKEVVSKLFSPVRDAPRAGLKYLFIKNSSLVRIAEVLPKKLALQDLRRLQLVGCRGEIPFIELLVTLRVALISYVVHFDSDHEAQRANEALLELMTSPTRLTITT